MSLINYIPNEDFYINSNIGLKRQANEDHCGTAETPNGYLFVVCDGMGGHVGGAVASEIAVESIIAYLKQAKYADVRGALNDALCFANQQIMDYAEQNPNLQGMGTTACIVLVQDSYVWFAHVGDSRIYLCTNQELHRITKDHSFVQLLVDKGDITDAEAETHPNRNRILRALGVKRDLETEVCDNPVQPAQGDIFLICSDGLCGYVNDLTMGAVLVSDHPLQQKGDELLQLALQTGGHDNITLELVQITNTDRVAATFVSKSPLEYRMKLDPVTGTPLAPIADAGARSNETFGSLLPPRRKPWKWIALGAVALIVLTVVLTFLLLNGNTSKSSGGGGFGGKDTTGVKTSKGGDLGDLTVLVEGTANNAVATGSGDYELCYQKLDLKSVKITWVKERFKTLQEAKNKYNALNKSKTCCLAAAKITGPDKKLEKLDPVYFDYYIDDTGTPKKWTDTEKNAAQKAKLAVKVELDQKGNLVATKVVVDGNSVAAKPAEAKTDNSCPELDLQLRQPHGDIDFSAGNPLVIPATATKFKVKLPKEIDTREKIKSVKISEEGGRPSAPKAYEIQSGYIVVTPPEELKGKKINLRIKPNQN